MTIDVQSVNVCFKAFVYSFLFDDVVIKLCLLVDNLSVFITGIIISLSQFITGHRPLQVHATEICFLIMGIYDLKLIEFVKNMSANFRSRHYWYNLKICSHIRPTTGQNPPHSHSTYSSHEPRVTVQ
ncbi:unnamed protein product [Chrysodeixis includens]|uniref:Uncharacterized protein n=1 Tax=Chrysodeixis includens TaxID=689277 RepID=A0A9N8L1K1_CHRIL|nr:unnamed protein product [Chrysodeixis includens]